MAKWIPTLPPDAEEGLEQFGLLGDYVGGFIGTWISVLALVFVFLTWRTTTRATTFNSTLDMLGHMLAAHDSDKLAHPELASRFHREFSAAYAQIEKSLPSISLPIPRKIDIAFTYAYYGTSFTTERYLTHDGLTIKPLHDDLSRMRNSNSGNKNYFSGMQAELSPYIRNLYAMYRLIDDARLSRRNKYSLARIVRSRLSNYEQALLMLNVLSSFGRDWEAEGLITRYAPFKNVPEHFFGGIPGFDMKSAFPNVSFEWERRRSRVPSLDTSHGT